MKNMLVIRQNSSEQTIVQIRYKFSHTEIVLALYPPPRLLAAG